jgi:hypothetical protein
MAMMVSTLDGGDVEVDDAELEESSAGIRARVHDPNNFFRINPNILPA